MVTTVPSFMLGACGPTIDTYDWGTACRGRCFVKGVVGPTLWLAVVMVSDVSSSQLAAASTAAMQTRSQTLI